jgi:hypothetical protein
LILIVIPVIAGHKIAHRSLWPEKNIRRPAPPAEPVSKRAAAPETALYLIASLFTPYYKYPLFTMLIQGLRNSGYGGIYPQNPLLRG